MAMKKVSKKMAKKTAPAAKKAAAKMDGMTPAQKKLPPFLQAAMAKKKKKPKY
jgi:hypothetical protein